MALYELHRDKNKMACAPRDDWSDRADPNEDLDQPGLPINTHSEDWMLRLIWVFTVRSPFSWFCHDAARICNSAYSFWSLHGRATLNVPLPCSRETGRCRQNCKLERSERGLHSLSANIGSLPLFYCSILTPINHSHAKPLWMPILVSYFLWNVFM